ncbi:MAG: pilus assembly protein N-terminal domain-containing protein, partial [Gammaproteobacteria bacterium]
MCLMYALAGLMPAWADHVVTLREGHQRVFAQAQPVERVAVGNPEIADVAMISKSEVLVTAKKAGATSLKLWSRGESAPQEYALEVLAPGAPDGRLVIDSQVQTDIKIVEVSRRALQEAGINLMKNTANTTLTIS